VTYPTVSKWRYRTWRANRDSSIQCRWGEDRIVEELAHGDAQHIGDVPNPVDGNAVLGGLELHVERPVEPGAKGQLLLGQLSPSPLGPQALAEPALPKNPKILGIWHPVTVGAALTFGL
jgi:hypothetical protein